MSRKAETFFDAVTLLREDLVEEAQDYVFRRRRAGWRKFGSLAACLVLVVSLGMLAALPRGCGGAAPSFDGNTASAPEEMPPGNSTGAPSGEGNPEPGDGDMNTAPPPDTAPPPQAEGLRFSAQVVEVLEDGLLVEPFDSAPADLGLVRVPTAGLGGLPEFYPGGVVMIRCGSITREGGEAVAEGVVQVELVELDSP